MTRSVLQHFCPQIDQAASVLDTELPTAVIEYVLDLSALATQCITIGLVSFASAHLGQLQPFFLEHGLTMIRLNGLSGPLTSRLSLSLQTTRLSCLDKMLKHPVMVFTRQAHDESVAQDILISPQDLIDLWGPGRYVKRIGSQPDEIVAIEIGGGYVHLVGKNLFHWERYPSSSIPVSLTEFPVADPILIAAHTTLNKHCRLDFAKSLKISSGSAVIGTCQEMWEESERQAGIQAGQYVTVQFLSTWAKRRGVTVKDVLRHIKPRQLGISFFEQLWGVQVSLCTGIARRVELREMLADVVIPFMEDRICAPGWKDLRDKHQIVDSLRGPNFVSWIQNLPQHLQYLLAGILSDLFNAFYHTGFDQTAQRFAIACPPPTTRCFWISCSNNHVWANALQDSDTSICFAYMTNQCLETNDNKCRGLTEGAWQKKAKLFETAVCGRSPDDQQQGQIVLQCLELGKNYWVGEPDDNLVARLVDQAYSPARLLVLKADFGERTIKLLRRLRRRKVPNGCSSLRERQKDDPNFIEVFMLGNLL